MDSYTDFVIHHRILFVVVSKWAYILKAGSNTLAFLAYRPQGDCWVIMFAKSLRIIA